MVQSLSAVHLKPYSEIILLGMKPLHLTPHTEMGLLSDTGEHYMRWVLIDTVWVRERVMAIRCHVRNIYPE